MRGSIVAVFAITVGWASPAFAVDADPTNYQAILPTLQPGDTLNLAPGSYSISPAVAKGSLSHHDMCDWIDNAAVFSIRSQSVVYGVLRMEVGVQSYVSQVTGNEQQITNAADMRAFQ